MSILMGELGLCLWCLKCIASRQSIKMPLFCIAVLFEILWFGKQMKQNKVNDCFKSFHQKLSNYFYCVKEKNAPVWKSVALGHSYGGREEERHVQAKWDSKDGTKLLATVTENEETGTGKEYKHFNSTSITHFPP